MKKILAIDDQKDNLTTIKAVIKSNMPDCKVLTALSGKEGIEIAKKEQPDTILLDIIMPQMDGYDVCKRLKEDESTTHIPVVMITAIKTDKESRIKGLDTGADAFLSKPIDPVELSAQVNVMLQIKGAEDMLRAEKELLDQKVKERTKELRESEENYRSIFEGANDGIIHVDKSIKVLNVNPAFTEITGISKEAAIGKSSFDLVNEFVNIKHLPRILNTMKSVISNKPIKPYELNYQDKILEISIRKQKNGQVVGIIRNITERKQAEEELVKYREHLEELVKERTQKLEEQKNELKRLNKLFVNREFRIKELRDRVKELEDKISE